MRVLFNNGYKVLEAANGEEALRLAQNHAAGVIDLLLSDVVMPQMGGIELAGCLHKVRPEIKILLTSGYTDEAPILPGCPNESIPFLQKPFMPSELLNQVREVLDS
jgi:response regulator RpfG family c-di-GMP phosphodiesterase